MNDLLVSAFVFKSKSGYLTTLRGNVNIATSLSDQTRQLHLFQSQGNVWNRLRFVNKCLALFEEISEKFSGKLGANFRLVLSILKTVTCCQVRTSM